jgi:hypothetical protein
MLNMGQAYLLMDDPDHFAEVHPDIEITVEVCVEAARALATQPHVMMSAPGRVGRNVEHVLLNYQDVEEDY